MSSSHQKDYRSHKDEDYLVSVVMAAYNAEKYIDAAINSVLSQTYRNLELHIVNDGSTDRTLDFIRKWATDPRLKYYSQENCGQTVAKNNGVRKCIGDFVAFCDADDFWDSNKLHIQIPYFQKNENLGVVYSNAMRISETGESLGRLLSKCHSGQITEKLFLTNFIPFGTAVIRRKCLGTERVFNEKYRMGIDWDLWLRLSLHYDFQYIDFDTYYYRVWRGQMSSNWAGRYKYCFMIMEDFIRENPEILPKTVIQEAYAHSYTNQARYRYAMERDFLGALSDIVKAVTIKPMYFPAWKELIKITAKRIIKERTLFEIPDVSRRHNKTPAPTYVVRSTSERVFNRLTIQTPRILMYHRFSDYDHDAALHIDIFAKQMEYISERCNVETLHQAMEAFSKKIKLSRPTVVVTIDDGYKDCFLRAMPILGELGLPATVFVTTGVVSGNLWMWPDALRYVLEKCEQGEFRVHIEGRHITFNLESHESLEKAWIRLTDLLVFKSNKVRFGVVNELARQAKCHLPSAPTGNFEPMTWVDLALIRDAGFEIGAHSFSHDFLPDLASKNRHVELVGAKKEIERRLSIKVQSFAYPNGTAVDRSPAMVAEIKKAGYLWAVTAQPRIMSRRKMYEIGRWSVGRSMAQFKNIVSGASIVRKRAYIWSGR